MKVHQLWALPALLTVHVLTVHAVPSPNDHLQQSLSTASRSAWKSLSDRLIGSIWGYEQTATDTSRARPISHRDRRPPPHVSAQYGDDVVVRFNLSTSEEAHSLAEAADTLLLDVWEFAEEWVDIRLAQDLVPALLGLLPSSLQHSHIPLPHLSGHNLAQAIHDTYPRPRDQRAVRTLAGASPHTQDRPFGPAISTSTTADTNIFFEDYQPLSVIEPWMRLMASLFTTHARHITIGTSALGRDIHALRLGVHPTNRDQDDAPKRPTILITGGLHAREWISTSTVLYIAYSLLTTYGKSAHVTHLLDAFDIVLIPTLNPDGYVYTWDTDRLWRKNRQPTSVRFCPGIDLDHAFGFEWDGARTAGNPCSESYAGEAPFAAHEAQQLADWARNETEQNNVDFLALLDLHSYSQSILYPYAYSCAATPPGEENLEELALGLSKAIRTASSSSSSSSTFDDDDDDDTSSSPSTTRTAGAHYAVMPACQGNVASDRTSPLRPLIESTGGSALDWFYHDLRIRYAYQIKLRDRGAYGFLLPSEQIGPVGREILEAVMWLGRALGAKHGLGVGSEVRMEEEGEHGDLGRDEEGEEEGTDQEGGGGDEEVNGESGGDREEDIETEALDDEIGTDWLLVEELGLENARADLRRRRRR